MKIELKPFQVDAVSNIRNHIDSAIFDTLHGHPQAIILSAPTGSGKTAIITTLMEWIFQGHDVYPRDSKAIFLWISDSPELNQQSKEKIRMQSSIFSDGDLITIESYFNQERFEEGKIYFLNTQKLSKENLLTRNGDNHNFTIWQTIINTIKHNGEHFYVIIDEAHRGMNEKPHDVDLANSIIQRFIKGYPEVGLPPINLIIGMSATPERFQKLVQGTGRILRPVEVNPDDVRNSGLLKDKLVLYYPDDDQPSDWSLLEQSVQRWITYTKEWSTYCDGQKIDFIEPILVIQVESGTKGVLTSTDLRTLVKVVERVTGELPDGAWAHSFQEDEDSEVDGIKIRKIDASQIEQDKKVRIVLFKMSLSTGWDCPRAEVLMSFRKAQDFTYIAQLVGRMVRTPLARSIETNDYLNSVSLFLPHYNFEGIQEILCKLKNPDPDTGISISTELGAQLSVLEINKAKDKAIEKLSTLNTYRIERFGKLSPFTRLMKLARQLTFDEIDKGIYSLVKKTIIDVLLEELHRLEKNDDFIGNQSNNQEIVAREISFEYGDWQEIRDTKTIKIQATSENIEDLFRFCDRLLGNEGLHWEYWRSRAIKDNPNKAKIELYGIVNEPLAWNKLIKVCENMFEELFGKYYPQIQKLTTNRIESYNQVRRSGKEPEPERILVAKNIILPRGDQYFEDHLYVEKSGGFYTTLNTWEMTVLNAERKKTDFFGWHRNLPRKPWSLSIPYFYNEEWVSQFPDLLIFRKSKNKITLDILDPHDSGLPDSVAKIKGLISYATKHGGDFGRICSIILDKENKIRSIDVKKESIQKRILNINDTDTGRLTEVYLEFGE